MKLRKWLIRSLFTIVIVIVLALLFILAGSEIKLRKTYDVALTPIDVPSDSVSLVEGKRLANLYHCSGCHEERLQGKVFFSLANVATLVAPNISSRMREYSNEELSRLIRHGVNKEGKAVWMPVSTQYYHMSDADVGKLISYLRTVPEVNSTITERTSIGLLGRIGIITGQFVQPAAAMDHKAIRIPKDTSSIVLGRYFSQTICATCHGNDFKGSVETGAPSLISAKAYNPEQFALLLKTGEGVARKNLGLMSIVSQKHFQYFTDREVKSIYQFLQTLN